jgi:hypothetical protein
VRKSPIELPQSIHLLTIYKDLSRSNDSSTAFSPAGRIQSPFLTSENTKAIPLTPANIPLSSTPHFNGTETMAGNFSSLNNSTKLAWFPCVWSKSGHPANPDFELPSQAMGDMQYSTQFADRPVEGSQDYTGLLLPIVQGVEENHTSSNKSRAPAHIILNEPLNPSPQSYMTLLENSDIDWDPSE